VLDSWWNEDYAKGECEHALTWYAQNRADIRSFGCTQVAACIELTPVIQDCQLHADPTAEVRDFEDRLTTYLATDPQCKGVRIVRFNDPRGDNAAAGDAMRGRYWMLFIDYMPGAAKQAWGLRGRTSSAFAKGEGDPQAIAAAVCAIATGKGAELD
jgi:hypothetical protein